MVDPLARGRTANSIPVLIPYLFIAGAVAPPSSIESSIGLLLLCGAFSERGGSPHLASPWVALGDHAGQRLLGIPTGIDAKK